MDDLYDRGIDGERENERNEVSGEKEMSVKRNDTRTGPRPDLHRVVFDQSSEAGEYLHFDHEKAFEKVLRRIDHGRSAPR